MYSVQREQEKSRVVCSEQFLVSLRVVSGGDHHWVLTVLRGSSTEGLWSFFPTESGIGGLLAGLGEISNSFVGH